jgi:ubiquinone/menaquinone biosynthesis C-methylase UbiE
MTSIENFPVKVTAQEQSRQDFVVNLRKYSTRELGSKMYEVYKSEAEPAFISKHGRAPESVSEVKSIMTENSNYQFWSALQRNSQEMVWDSVIDTTERTLDQVKNRLDEAQPLGSLDIDPEFSVPKYHQMFDIHLQPGGYHTEQVPEDIAAGMIYDLGVPIYSMKAMGRENDSTGLTVLNAYKTLFPDQEPERVLDIGCAIGNSTLPWAQAFENTEVHGIDVAAPCLRYGHLRANAYGKSLHLSQQNAEKMSFPDNHFDVVVSALLFHETSTQAVPNILEEIKRILKPGGTMIHFDGFDLSKPEPVLEFLSLWEVYNNNEYFLMKMQSMDMLELSKAKGFEEIRFEPMPFILTAPQEKSESGKGYMGKGGFGTVELLVAQKPKG